MSSQAAPETWRIPGTRHFQSDPCATCGCALRYMVNRRCVDCTKAKSAERTKLRPKDPKATRAQALRRMYNLSVEAFDALFDAQGKRCAICKTTQPTNNQTWHVDHDHVSGAVRGILCAGCNRGLGYFADSADALVAAADYLKSDAQAARVFFAREVAWLENPNR